jgi:U3 small nucleolar RNA-associated protein 10
LLPHIEELLPAYVDGEATDPELWTLLVRVLGKSFEVDEGAFWTEALYLKLIPLLTAQIGVFPDRTRLSTSEALPYTLGAMAASTTSESSLKALNTRICMATREEDVNVRLAALRVMEAVWERQAEEMVGLVPETVSEYLAELLEDENADVEAMARGVLGKIEKVTGSLQEYLE